MTAVKTTSFKDLGLIDELCDVCEAIGWKEPTQIQKEALPVGFKGGDIVGLAETGSGKTGAFCLPLLQALVLEPKKKKKCFYGLILTPTRELALQIKVQLDALGSELGLKTCAVVGGVDAIEQAKALKVGPHGGPHIIVATLGRLADHIKNLKDFSRNIANTKYLVMDEADRILKMDFEKELDNVMRALPNKQTTMLFSATIDNKIKELQRAHLNNPTLVEVNSSFKIVDTLKQYLIPVVLEYKNVYLVHLLRTLTQKSVIVFCNTRRDTLKTAFLLRQCGLESIPLYGDMTQDKRNEALKKFREKSKSILVATDVASRGLDIPCVDYVILYEVPSKSEDYIHRVGRTARAGRTGVAFNLVSQYEIEVFLNIEQLIKAHCPAETIPVYPLVKDDVMKIKQEVLNAEKMARMELKAIDEKRRAEDSDEDEDATDAGRPRHKRKRTQLRQDSKNTKKKFKNTKRK